MDYTTHKRFIRKRNKLFHKQKSAKSPTDRHHFLRVKQHIKMKIRQSYDLYIEDILGLTSNSDRKDQNTAIELTDSNKGQSQFSIKKLFSLIKNSRQVSEGIAPLQMPDSENLATQSKDKADIANQQFQKAFSKKQFILPPWTACPPVPGYLTPHPGYLHPRGGGGGARWLSGRVSDCGARGPGFETYRRRVVSLSKTLYSPKVLVNYPGSDGSVPT